MAEQDRLRAGFIVLLRVAVPLTLVLIMLGAYVRLSDAGLGCPDWPGCYGQLFGMPQSPAGDLAASHGRPLDLGKAWREMAHRYLAGVVGLVIMAMAIVAWLNRRDQRQMLILPGALLALVILQALLGMWTVTLLLKPAVVTAHLLGGIALIAMLWCALLVTHPCLLPARPYRAVAGWLRPGMFFVLFLLFAQIVLGGWTSSNYAALACLDFPTCRGYWWPPLDFAGAVSPLFAEAGQNFEFGVLDNAARMTIHFTHRLGALLLGLAMLVVLAFLFRRGHAALRYAALTASLLLLTQIALGIANVVFGLPIVVATAHNGVAVLLALSWLTLIMMTRRASPG